jgi:glycosyltransferase involved in cell wall biosynthesis
MIRKLVVDALQIPAEYSGVGRQALAIGPQLGSLPHGLELEVRCPENVRNALAAVYPPETRFRTPLRRSRPRTLRILYQQVVAPMRDSRATLLLCLGDQGPIWGRARLVLTVNDVRRLTNPNTSGRLEAALYRTLVPRAARHAARIITISEFSRREIQHALGDGLHVEVVAHHPAPKVSEPAIQAGADTVLCVGAYRPYKGLETVIDALALLDSPRLRLVLAGPLEGREAELRRHADTRGVADRVKLLGWVDETLLDGLYRSALATVSASTYEGYGLPVAESLSYGLPTIASDIPPHREIGGAAALFFAAGDAPALAACMRRVALPGQAEELSRMALDRCVSLQGSGPSWRALLLDAAA